MDAFLFSALLSLVLALIHAQGSSSFAGSIEPTELVTENLKHMAATAEQILETLNWNTCLMVELKRWITQDAGESGQVLEESLKTQVTRGSGCGSPANRPVHL